MVRKNWVILKQVFPHVCFVLFVSCVAMPYAQIYSSADDICTHTAQVMHQHANTYKKYIKDIESEFKLLRGAAKGIGWCSLGKWTIKNIARSIARTRGYSKKEVNQARILGRFIDAGNAKSCAITAVTCGEGADILTRIFSQLKARFGVLRKTAELRAALIDLLHQEMMRALGLSGSKDWFCDEIERKDKKKQYVIRDNAFNI
jgi:hypothetical protein